MSFSKPFSLLKTTSHTKGTMTSTTTNMLKAAAFVAPVLSLSVASADLSYSLLFAPALLSTATAPSGSPSLALHQIRESFQIGQFIFPTSAGLAAALFGALAWACAPGSHRRMMFIVAAALNVSIMPITTLYLFPKTNKRILQLEQKTKDASEKVVDTQHRQEVIELLKSFARINLVRGVLFWSGGALGLWTVLY